MRTFCPSCSMRTRVDWSLRPKPAWKGSFAFRTRLNVSFDLSTSAKSVCRTLKFLPSILAWRTRKTFCKGLVRDPWNSLRTVLTRPRLLISRRYLKNYDLWSVSSQSKKVFVVKNMSLTKLRDVRKRKGYELRISKDLSVLQYDRF